MKIAFCDTETTGLDPFLHDPWEIAVILRDGDKPDTEHVYRIQPDLTNAEPEALKINHYHERTSAEGWRWDDSETAAHRLYALLDGAVLVGSNPAFDADMIGKLFGRHYDQPRPWHYRMRDAADMAAGYLYGRASELTRLGCDASYYERVDKYLAEGWKSRELSRAVQVEPPGDDAHQALADARWMRDVYDAVTKPDAFYTASDEQLAAWIEPALRNGPGGEA